MAGRNARERAERDARRRLRSFEVRKALHEERRRRIRRDDVVAGVALVVVLALATLSQSGWATVGPGAPRPSASAAPTATATPTPSATRTLPPASLSEDRTWTGSLTLNSTRLSVSLAGKRAPQAVANFVSLAGSGFYDGTPCHRLTTTGIFVLQCGDPTGTGTGGPGYTFGPLEDVPASGVYPAGTIAMARGTAEDSQGSQFFIVYRTSELPAPGYTVLGKVTGGLAALRTAITDRGTTAAGGDGAPVVATTITAVSVR